MNRQELLAERVKRGTEYASAAAAYRNALVRLAGAEDALRNSRFGHSEPVRGFGHLPDIVSMRHGEFAPDIAGNWASQIAVERDALLAEVA